ncbi:MAG: TIGR02996 domain-containing protein [Planctomycetia bacterium]|nr:TIGR02996 domain-containing protein [Planctomycetia bacterium]
MKHPDWPAFIAAIIANPDEDTPRLVAADFLEENGESDRAAFIRIQCEIALLEASGLSKSLEMDELRKKERAILHPLSVHWQLWAAEECPELVRVAPPTKTSSPLDRIHVEGADRLAWRRGFVEAVRCFAGDWLRCGVAVRKRQPVQDVTLTDCNMTDRDMWYAGLAAVSGLRNVFLNGTNPVLAAWLAEWLPGTNVKFVRLSNPDNLPAPPAE